MLKHKIICLFGKVQLILCDLRHTCPSCNQPYTYRTKHINTIYHNTLYRMIIWCSTNKVWMYSSDGKSWLYKDTVYYKLFWKLWTHTSSGKNNNGSKHFIYCHIFYLISGTCIIQNSANYLCSFKMLDILYPNNTMWWIYMIYD